MVKIVADGEARLKASPEFRAKIDAERQSIEARYADELASANFARSWLIRLRMRLEIQRELRQISPAPQSLY